ncbi:hypothetical protein [Helicobacter sp. 12S02232-10]|uniref:hypothetical protein n=1 Tax=Helicobacter sp. 12S02232-10 TaxID=1476197 RepID=UPI00117B9365|nr:hypothetical protein [Helicobacter sp. 12S02232-10]
MEYNDFLITCPYCRSEWEFKKDFCFYVRHFFNSRKKSYYSVPKNCLYCKKALIITFRQEIRIQNVAIDERF